MRGFIFIWWSCRPLFPEWIIRMCRCWALFIFIAVAESIRSILHTIFKIIQDRQHNSHSIRIQMTADGRTTYSKTNTADFQCRNWLSHDHLDLDMLAQTVLFQGINLQGILYLDLVLSPCFVKSCSKIIHVIAESEEDMKVTVLHCFFLVLACAFSWASIKWCAEYISQDYNSINVLWTVSTSSDHKNCSPWDGSRDERGVPGGHSG